jgi:perosamine synthetase
VNRISLAAPALNGNERAYVLDCLETNWISSIGKYIAAFEESFAQFCGVGHAIATNNGTTALHLALVALGVGPGDEVLVPTLTYVATANAVRYCGAVPVFIDSSADTLGLDPNLIERAVTPRTKGILPVHLYGHPADMTRINEAADRFGLWTLEDAAEAHGAEVGGRRVGSLGRCATFSFFGNKIVTTGEGGMVTTDDAELAARLRLFRGQGMDPNRRYWFPVVGYNYRITNIQAAIGVAQMETIDDAISCRDELARIYDEAMYPLLERIEVLPEQPWARRVFWMYNVFLRDGDEARRDRVMAGLDALGIESRPVFYPMHRLPPYEDGSSSYPVADARAARGITLPMHQALVGDDIERIAASLAEVLDHV